MPGDVMKTVASGSPVRPSAQWQNRVNKAVKRSETDNRSLSAGNPAIRVPEGLIYVQNNSGADRKRFEVLGINDILYSPDDNKPEFQNRPSIIGVTPIPSQHFAAFVICAEPIASKAVGRAWIFGICPVQINIQSTSDGYADVDATATQLKSGNRGAAQILWAKRATGTQWALVRLGAPTGGGLMRVNLTQTGGTAGSSTAPPSWVYTANDDNGNTLGTGLTPARGRDYNGKRNAAAYGYGEYINGNFVLDEAWESPTTFACST